MKITRVIVRPCRTAGAHTIASASVFFDHSYVANGILLQRLKDGQLHARFPYLHSGRAKGGKRAALFAFTPVSQSARREIERAIIHTYQSQGGINMTNRYATILFYTDDIAICEDAFADLFYTDVPELFAEPGCVVELEAVSPISELPADTQARIRAQLAVLPAAYLESLRIGFGGEDDA